MRHAKCSEQNERIMRRRKSFRAQQNQFSRAGTQKGTETQINIKLKSWQMKTNEKDNREKLSDVRTLAHSNLLLHV